MNLKNILPPHLRSKVYFAVGLFGLVIGSGIVGIAALTAGGLTVPVAVTAGLTALNAIYVYVAGAFGFIAQANTPEGPNTIQVSSPDFEDIEYIEDVVEALPEATVDGMVEDDGPVG